MHPNREVGSVSPAWWICCPFALFINCWIHWLSIGSFSVSCYTTIELQPRCHPSFLMGTGDCGAALLPWQQALSHSPHIACSVHVPPTPHPTPTNWSAPQQRQVCSQTGPSQGYLPPALIPDALLIQPPTLHFLLSLLLMHSVSHWLLSQPELCSKARFFLFLYVDAGSPSSRSRMVILSAEAAGLVSVPGRLFNSHPRDLFTSH